MKLTELHKNIILYLILISLLSTSTIAQDDDVELRIDFTSGAVIANETPKIVNPISDMAVPLGTTDTVVADLNEVFNDAESGSALTFKAKVLDGSLVNVDIKRSDSTAHFRFWPGMKGRTRVVFSASDGSKEVSDTINVIVKNKMILNGTLADTVVKSSYSVVPIKKDISNIFPVGTPQENYKFKVSSSDPALIGATASYFNRSITMVIADSSYGRAEIEITIIDSDGLSVRDTFAIEVKKRYSTPQYSREIVGINPGISVYTGIEYSGAFLKFWVKDVFGIALGGYYHWDLKGKGLEGQLLLKPPLNFPLHPYMMLSGGYHRITEDDLDEDLNIKTEDELSIPVFRAAGGLDVWMGKSKLHVISVEGGYVFGRKEYKVLSVSQFGSESIATKKQTYKMPPLHLRLAYTVFFRKL